MASDKKEWSKDVVMELISLYEENSILWNSKDKDYRNREKKEAILKEISSKFNCTASEIQRKFHNLRNQVSQELKKTKIRHSGEGTDDVYMSSWPYLKALKFLIPVLTVNKTKSSMPTTTTSSLESTIIDEAAPETEEQNRGEDQANEKQTNVSEIKKQGKRKHQEEDESDKVFKQAMEVLLKQPNADDLFGQYVAMELKALSSDFNKKRLKMEIRRIITRIVEEDDNLQAYSSSSSTSMSVPSTSVVPTPSPSTTDFSGVFSPQQFEPIEPTSINCAELFQSFNCNT